MKHTHDYWSGYMDGVDDMSKAVRRFAGVEPLLVDLFISLEGPNVPTQAQTAASVLKAIQLLDPDYGDGGG
jgi:hypothetical protein